MSRSIWKLPVISLSLKKEFFYLENLFNDSNLKNNASHELIRTRARNTVITWDFVGKLFSVHNGLKHANFEVTSEMIGHKLGEFSATRTLFVSHKKKKKK